MIKIVAGKYRSRQINAPAGFKTRPTTARVRESVFSALCCAYGKSDLSGARIWDAFAGSGALGIEAISRSADTCVFTDVDFRAVKCIKENLQLLGISSEVGSVYKSSALSAETCRRVFDEANPDIIFIDAPYSVPPADLYAIVENLQRFCTESRIHSQKLERHDFDDVVNSDHVELTPKSSYQNKFLVYYEHIQSIVGTPWQSLVSVYSKKTGDITADIFEVGM